MTMYLKLMKVIFKESFSMKRVLGTGNSKSKVKLALLVFAIIYGLGSFFFAFGFLFYNLGKVFDQMGAVEVLLLYTFMYATFLSAIFILFRANGYLFNYKDYQILEPLPIKNNIVTYAKASVMMILIYLSLFVFTAPIAFSYFWWAGFNIFSFLIYIIGLLCLPLIPTIILSFVSLLFSQITSRFKRAHLINTALTFILVFGIIYLSYFLNSASGLNPLLNQQDFVESLSKYYPVMKWFMNAVNDRNILDLLLLVVVNGGLFYIFLTLIQKLVLKTNQKGIIHRTSKHKKLTVSKKSSVFGSFLSKEFGKLLNTSIYALNSGFGAIILIVAGIASVIFADQINGFLGQLSGLPINPEMMVLIIIAFCLSTIYTSAISLSLEGKNFWIIKSLPIKAKTVMFSKMFFNVLLGLPVAVFALLMATIVIKSSFVDILVMILYISTLSLSSSAMGSIINLTFPKFDFINPVEVVKQSAGAVLGLFGTWTIVFLNGLLVYLLLNKTSWELSIILSSILNGLIFTGFYMYIDRKSESLFIKMQA